MWNAKIISMGDSFQVIQFTENIGPTAHIRVAYDSLHLKAACIDYIITSVCKIELKYVHGSTCIMRESLQWFLCTKNSSHFRTYCCSSIFVCSTEVIIFLMRLGRHAISTPIRGLLFIWCYSILATSFFGSMIFKSLWKPCICA